MSSPAHGAYALQLISIFSLILNRVLISGKFYLDRIETLNRIFNNIEILTLTGVVRNFLNPWSRRTRDE